MDVKVYKKEEVLQPTGTVESVYVPDIIDIYPQLKKEEVENDIVDEVWNIGIYASQHNIEIKNNTLFINDETSSVSGEVLILNYDLVVDVLSDVTILTDDSKELVEQQCALATIFQKGLDPLDKESGIHWSETLLGEINPIQLMEEIETAIAETTTSVAVEFDTITDANGNSYLTYKLKETA